MELLGLFYYWVFAIVLMIGFYAVIAKRNLIKKLIGLSIFQAAVFLLYITMGKVEGGTAPIFQDGVTLYSNPLPQVLILTAIVVGISTTALGLGIVVRIKEEYGSIEEDEIQQRDRQPAQCHRAPATSPCDTYKCCHRARRSSLRSQ